MPLNENGDSCFEGTDCKDGICSICPLELRCGPKIKSLCSTHNDCCSLKCESGICVENKGGNVLKL